MSAIAARKARLALQAELQVSASSISDLDQAGPSSIPLTPKRKALMGKAAIRPSKISRQKQRKVESSQRYTAQPPPQYGRSSEPAQLDIVQEGDDSNDIDDSSDESDVSTDDEKDEIPDNAHKGSNAVYTNPAYSTFTPILSGKRKNWHLDDRKKQDMQKEVSQDASLIIGLAPSQTIVFVGMVRVKVLNGHCNIAGASLTPHHHSVIIFAPQNAPLPLLQASSGPPSCRSYPDYGLSDSLFTAILKVTSLSSIGINDISIACPLVRSGCFTLPSSSPTLQGFYPVLQPIKGLVSTIVSPSWEQALSSLAETNTTFICLIKGPKRVGKSTFSRYLLNRLVSTRRSSVAYLETDLGQAEFGPPGIVALHLFESLSAPCVDGDSDLVIGPSWTSLRYPLRSHFVGDTTPRDDPNLYNESIADLIQYYQENLKSKDIPLIVNTQGWVKGLGADLLSNLEKTLQPTQVVELIPQDDDGDGTLQHGISTSIQHLNRVMLLRLEAAPLCLTRDRGLNAVEARTLNLISYFYSIRLPSSIPGLKASPQWDFSLPLVQQRPYIVNVGQGLSAGLFIMAKGARVDKKLQLMAFNGSCVAIVSTSQRQTSPSLSEVKSSVWKGALSKEMPSIQSCNFLCLAIVRSIDLEKGHIHLVTPIPTDQLHPSHHNALNQLYLVKGAIEVPIWLSLNYSLIESIQSNQHSTLPLSQMLLEGVPLPEVPYLDFAPESNIGKEDRIIGQERRKVRRNLLRRGQQRGSTG